MVIRETLILTNNPTTGDIYYAATDNTACIYLLSIRHCNRKLCECMHLQDTKKENIAVNRSHCMSCNHVLAWYDLVPLFSWIFLRGKCRYCGEKISGQYPLVEFINGVGYVWIFLVSGMNVGCILYCLTFSALIALSVIDWRTYEIPVGINGFILVMGIMATAIDYKNILNHIIGFVSVSGFLLILYYATKDAE